MTPKEKFLRWGDAQNIAQCETVAFQILYLSPNYDMEKMHNLNSPVQNFKDYLSNETSVKKIVGKLLYIKNAIDFITLDYDNVDTLIDSQNLMKDAINDGEAEAQNMDYIKKLHSKGNVNFEIRKEFKKNWEKFSNENLNFEILKNYLNDDFINKTL